MNMASVLFICLSQGSSLNVVSLCVLEGFMGIKINVNNTNGDSSWMIQ